MQKQLFSQRAEVKAHRQPALFFYWITFLIYLVRARWHHLNSSELRSLQPHQEKGSVCALQAATAHAAVGTPDSRALLNKFTCGNINPHCWQVKHYNCEGRKSIPSPEAGWEILQIVTERERDVEAECVLNPCCVCSFFRAIKGS